MYVKVMLTPSICAVFCPHTSGAQRAQVKLAKTFVYVINVTSKPEQTYWQWSNNMVECVLAAGPATLTDIAQALHSFCECFNVLGQEGGKQASEISDAAAALFSSAKDIIHHSMGGILGGLSTAMESKLLFTQPFFPEDASFLPEVTDDSKTFFQEAVQFCTESNAEGLRDTLRSMGAALKNANLETGFDLDKCMDQYARHELMAFCCVCWDNLEMKDETPIAKLKTQVQCLEQALTAMADIIKSSDSSWATPGKTWIGKNVIAKIFGHGLTVIHGLMQTATDAMPDVDNLIINRNADKLRKLVFNQDTHKACVNGLEELGSIMKSLENVVTAGNSIGLMQVAFLNKIKAAMGKLGRMKQYSSVVHGLNLLFHRFTNKAKIERSALLREILDWTFRLSVLLVKLDLTFGSVGAWPRCWQLGKPQMTPLLQNHNFIFSWRSGPSLQG